MEIDDTTLFDDMLAGESIQSAHGKLVRRLAKSPIAIQGQLSHAKIAMMHAVLGLAGEVGELEDVCAKIMIARSLCVDPNRDDVTNLLEEVGDLAFYATDLRNVLSLPPFAFMRFRHGTVQSEFNPTVALGNIVDKCKKHIIYGASITEAQMGELHANLDLLESYYVQELETTGYTYENALGANMHKLNLRYPQGYTDQAAKERADKAFPAQTLKVSTVKTIEVANWDRLVASVYGRPYCLQQQGGCMDRGNFDFTVPAPAEDYDTTELPEVINGNDRGVSFATWLARDPKAFVAGEGGYVIGLYWDRSFYPEFQTLANDLHAKGLIAAGDYRINIDW